MSEGIQAVQKEYAQLAAAYDRRWNVYVTATVGQTLNRAALQPGESLLDIGCGTGTLLHQLLPHRGRMVGVDTSDEMLAIARRKLLETVALIPAIAEHLPLPEAAFDVVVSTSAFHYFPRPEIALGEMKRVLKSGGRLIITDWCHDYVTCQLCDFFLQRFNSAHSRAYRARECIALLRAAGFKWVTVERYKISWLWGMMTATARLS